MAESSSPRRMKKLSLLLGAAALVLFALHSMPSPADERSSPPRRPAQSDPERSAEPGAQPIVLEFEPCPGRISIRILTTDRRPVVGAAVSTRCDGQVLFEAKSNARGLADVPMHHTLFAIEARQGNLVGRASVRPRATLSGALREIVVRPVRHAEVRVVTDGGPVEGAWVQASGDRSGAGAWTRADGWARFDLGVESRAWTNKVFVPVVRLLDRPVQGAPVPWRRARAKTTVRVPHATGLRVAIPEGLKGAGVVSLSMVRGSPSLGRLSSVYRRPARQSVVVFGGLPLRTEYEIGLQAPGRMHSATRVRTRVQASRTSRCPLRASSS